MAKGKSKRKRSKKGSKRRKKKSKKSRKPKVKSFKKMMPHKQVIKVKYVTQQPAAGSGTNKSTVVQMRGTSGNDPEYAVGGHQPYGWDTLASLYGKYRVLKAKCSVVASSNATGLSASRPELVLMISDSNLDVDPLGLLTYPEIMERGFNYTKSRKMPAISIVDTDDGVPTDRLAIVQIPRAVRASRTIRPKKWTNDDSKAGNYAIFSANPSNEFFFNIYLQCIDDDYSFTWTAFILTITMEYWIEVIEPKVLGES